MKAFTKILIANRGEIALRIMRSAKEMGIRCGVVYTPEESGSWFVKEADEAYSLGSGSMAETYLNISKIIRIAMDNNFTAIHPGYGFLSENADFAEVCTKNSIVFIGPDASSIRLMGNKLEALRFVSQLEVPVLGNINGNYHPGNFDTNLELAYPVIIKAAAGGGGKAMRIVYSAHTLQSSMETASREANAYFGNDQIFVERYIEKARHIEVQIIADNFGNVVHLYDRECTIQRRHQKIIEEAPSPILSEDVREKLFHTAKLIANRMNYRNAGTMEFLMDEKENFYFLEMNTRVQVEHPVTEEITDIDIVKLQIGIAQGNPLGFSQKDVQIKGHAIECRIYAEDAFAGFLPSSGKIQYYHQPECEGIRVESAVNGYSEVSPDFDPMISKVIAYSDSRENARLKLLNYLSHYSIHGIITNINYLTEILNHPKYIVNILSTKFCFEEQDFLYSQFQQKLTPIFKDKFICALLIFLFSPDKNKNSLETTVSLWKSIGYWRQNMFVKFSFLSENYEVFLSKPQTGIFLYSLNGGMQKQMIGWRNGKDIYFNSVHSNSDAQASSEGDCIYISMDGITLLAHRTDTVVLQETNTSWFEESIDKILSPITGKVVKINFNPMDKVNKGDVIMVIESMKMENNILSPRDGQLDAVMFKTGDRVSGRDVVALISR